MSPSRKRLIHEASEITGQTPYQLQKIPTAELEMYVGTGKNAEMPQFTVKVKDVNGDLEVLGKFPTIDEAVDKILVDELHTNMTAEEVEAFDPEAIWVFEKNGVLYNNWGDFGETNKNLRIFQEEKGVPGTIQKLREYLEKGNKLVLFENDRAPVTYWIESKTPFPRKQYGITEVRKDLIEKVSRMTGQTPQQLQDLPTDELKRYVKRNSVLDMWEGKKLIFKDGLDEGVTKERLALIKRVARITGKLEKNLVGLKPSELRKMIPKKSR